ncbi:hypothetical protein NLJ89_g6761 [Agrocybe chaxingu]|uniref:Calcineurin-like phosphoesterase domain-containing protein n=1 Tax=Agrocybe chaxingu TaxID=84603 RepID=A0A9W8MTS6_9AGAR|nr:hypothetical protein NLJ89_g6761 [Agrocybe chaxingu]
MSHWQLRQIVAYGTLSFFLVFVLSFGIADSLLRLYPEGVQRAWGIINTLESAGDDSLSIPDFTHYEQVKTLDEGQFPLYDPTRRVIIVGDIHGMIKPFKKLLKRVDYSPSKDLLIHVGDVMVKGSHSGSMAVLHYLASHNITGVRGNHDQQIIEWRGWLNWISSLPGGRCWLENLEKKWSDSQEDDDDLDLEFWMDNERTSSSKSDKKWWKLIPEGWVLFTEHYQLAREMSKAQYQYLLNLPLRLYVPSAHLFVAHAGMLAANPKYPLDDKRNQPLARVPVPSRHRVYDNGSNTTQALIHDIEKNFSSLSSHKRVHALRNLQELGLLLQIPQNADGWLTLNMRSIVDGEVTKSKSGRPWADLWREQMKSCVGYDPKGHVNDSNEKGDLSTSDVDVRKKKGKKYRLPCYPSSVVYGHAASRGLDVKRWSFGIDTGCVYERQLTALIVGGVAQSDLAPLAGNEDGSEEDEDKEGFADRSKHDDDDDDDDDETGNWQSKRPIPFGDNARARIVSVKC